MLVERRESPIHGNGVFAREPLEPGDWMFVYGEVIPLHPHPMEHYCLEHDRGQYLPYAPFCWTNHSDSPNCEMVWCEDGEVYYIETLRAIKRGEELTIDYGFTPQKDTPHEDRQGR
jgi:SET domain-containing protein